MASTRAGKYCAPFLSSVSRLPATYCMRLRALELRADRQVIRQHRPGLAAMHPRGGDLEAAHVNAVEPQQRQHAGEGRQRAAVMRHRHLGHAEPALENRRGAMPPLAVRKELVLRLGGAGGEAHGVALVQSLHFLQEHEVRIELPQAFAQLVDHHAAIEVRQSLVDVEGDDAQAPGQRHFGAPAARRSISATMAVNCSVTVLRSAATPISGGSSKSGSISPTYRSSTVPCSASGWIS